METNRILEILRSEIERRIKIQDDWAGRKVLPGRDLAFAVKEELKQLLSFLDTLESGKPMNLDFEQELYNRFGMVKDFTLGMRIAQAFYDLGCRRTADKYDEIEYNRQRAEEHLATSGKTLEIKPGDEVTINGHKVAYNKDKDAITMEEIPNDLEEAANEYEKKHTYQRYDGGGFTPEYDATLAEAVIFGAKWQKEQMMKEAVEGEVCIPNVWVEHKEGKELVVRAEISKELGFKFGDKVRVIVLPKECEK